MQGSQASKPVVFGEVLFDQFPDGSVVLGGAPFNVAWHLQAFGLSPLFISQVGTDSLGQKIRNSMQNWGMDMQGMQLDPEHPTGTVKVHLRDGEPSFDIVSGVAYDFIDASRFPAIDSTSVIYHGTLVCRNPVSNASLLKLQHTTSAPTFVDVNLRDPWWDAQQVFARMHNADWIKLNDAELQTLVPSHDPLHSQAAELQAATGAKMLVVTRGGQGAMARTLDGHIEEIFPSGRVNVVDTVGAGDAFASVTLTGLILDWSLPLTLQRAQSFASAIVSIRGATVDDPLFYRPFVEAWDIKCDHNIN